MKWYKYFHRTLPFLAGITELSVLNNSLKKTITIPWSSSSEIDSDAMEYHEIGIPVVSLISAPLYLYDLIDTPDKVAKEQLRPVGETFIEIIKTIDDTPTCLIKL